MNFRHLQPPVQILTGTPLFSPKFITQFHHLNKTLTQNHQNLHNQLNHQLNTTINLITFNLIHQFKSNTISQNPNIHQNQIKAYLKHIIHIKP